MTSFQFAAELTGIQEGFQTDIGEDAELMTGQSTEPMNEGALRKVIGFDFIIDSQLPDCRYGLPMTDDGPFQKARMSQVFGSAAVANPLRTCVNIGKVLRFVRFQKPFFQGFGQRFRMGAADKPDRCDRIVILYLAELLVQP